MPKKKQQQQLKGLTREQLKRIWKPLDAAAFLSLAKDYKPHHGFIPDGFNKLKGRCLCPDHEDKDPSFFIYADKHFAKCRGCGKYITNPVELIQLFTDFTVSETVTYLKEQFNIKCFTKSALAELETQRLKQLMKKEIFAATHQYMCEVIANPGSIEFAAGRDSLEWLTKTRNISQDALHTLPVGIMPSSGNLGEILIRRFKAKERSFDKNHKTLQPPEDITAIANEYINAYSSWNSFPGSIVFPLHATPSEIGRIKLRGIHSDGKKDFVTLSDDYEDLLGLFGLGWSGYNHLFTKTKVPSKVYVTEGEIDVLSWMSRIVTNHGAIAPFPLVSAGGMGSSANIEPIINSTGAKEVYLIGDAPEAQGDVVVQEWLSNIKELKTRIFTGWPTLTTHKDDKDLDDVVSRNGEIPLIRELFDNIRVNFTAPSDWAFGQAQTDIEAIVDPDLRTLVEASATHGRYLLNRLDRTDYTQKISQAYSLNESLLQREIAARDNTAEGFILNICDAIQQLLFVVGHGADSSGGRNLYLYNTKTHTYYIINLANEKSVKSVLAPVAGRIVNFIRQHVGIPKFLEDTIDGLSDKAVTQNLVHYLSEACLMLAEGAPDMASIQPRQGYHCIKNRKNKTVEYVVCGPDVFHLTRKGDEVTYHKLDGPADHSNSVVFNLDAGKGLTESPWTGSPLTIERLTKQFDMNFETLFKDLVTFYSVGFQFQNHDIMAQLVAASVLCFPIAGALLRPQVMFVTGDSSSGKTNLLSTFTNEIGPNEIRMMKCAQGFEYYSLASVASSADNDGRLLVLDEFESNDAKKSEAVPGILEMFRGLVTGPTRRSKGQPGGGASIIQYFKMPVVFAAIQGAAKPQDANRMIMVHMQRIDHRPKPSEIIIQHFEQKRLDEMSESCTVGMFQYAQELAEIEKQIKTEYSEKLQKKLPVKLEWRHASGLFGPLAVMKLAGMDYKKFLIDYVEANAVHLKRMSELSESEATLSHMLRNPVVPMEENRRCSVAELLASPERRHQVNSSEFGTYYDKDTGLILVLLDTAIIKLLQYTYKKYGMSTQQLKNTLDRHTCAITDEDTEKSGILRKIGPVLGAGIQTKDVSVFRAERWLTQESELLQETTEETDALGDKLNDGNENNNEKTEKEPNQEKEDSDQIPNVPDAADSEW